MKHHYPLAALVIKHQSVLSARNAEYASWPAGPFLNIYYSSQFAPLIIFFLLFLSVVKNFRLHHFTRFHCMQAGLSCSGAVCSL